MSLPAIAPRRHHRQNRQRPLTLIKLVRSRSKEIELRASDDVLRGFGQGRAVTACAESALPLEEKTSLLAQIRVTLCDIKLAAGEGNERPRHGEPRETPCRPFYDHTMCSYLTGAKTHRPRRYALACPRFAVWKRWAREKTRRTSQTVCLSSAACNGFGSSAKMRQESQRHRIKDVHPRILTHPRLAFRWQAGSQFFWKPFRNDFGHRVFCPMTIGSKGFHHLVTRE